MKTAFREVRDDLRRRIVEGEWGLGRLIPNEVDLAAEYGCARTTVNRALRELAEEGLVERKRKAGTRVRAAPLRRAQFTIPVIAEEVRAEGADYGYALVEQCRAELPGDVARHLSLPGGTPALHVRCLHLADGKPYVFEDRWINLRAIPQAADADFAQDRPTEWLVAAVPFSEVEISFSATAADAELARHLGAGAGDPLFRMERTTWWAGKTVTHVRLTYRPGHQMTTRY